MFISKIIIAVCLGLIAVVYAGDGSGEMSIDDIADAVQSMADECEHQPITRDHIKQMIRNDEDAEYSSKCLRRCLFEQFDVMQKGDTKMNVSKAVEMLGMMFSDGKEDMEEIVGICNGINESNTEPCENAHEHGMCVIKELKQRNYKVPKIE